MRAVRDGVAQAVFGTLGVVCGLLSALALAVAALIPPILGLLAFLLVPLRVLIERLRGSRAAS